MNNTGYVILSRQSGLTKELNAIANNIANVDTVGFRSESFLFSEYIRRLGSNDRSLSQTNSAGRFFEARPGALIKTNARFDVAIDGDGFFVVDTPRGQRLTRAGGFMLNTDNQLSTSKGYPVFGEGGSPISAPINANNVAIAPDGSISVDGAPIGKLMIVTVEQTALAREGENLFRTDAELKPIEQPNVLQGFLEQSNVNAVLELSRLIEVQRAYELNQQLISIEDERISRVIENAAAR